MAFRIDQYVFTPGTLVLPFALAFFLVLSYQRLYPRVLRSAPHAAALLVLSTICGAAGAWLHGRWAGLPQDPVLHAWLDIRFGSIGGYWGALLAGALYALATRHSPAQCADALTPGILVGAAVARIGCLFTGCCQGMVLGAGAGFQPFRPWPVYDMAALLITLGFLWLAPARMNRFRSAGGTVCVFLIVYGVLRFLIEFVRDPNAMTGALTMNQWMALAQLAVGGAILMRLKPHGAAP